MAASQFPWIHTTSSSCTSLSRTSFFKYQNELNFPKENKKLHFDTVREGVGNTFYGRHTALNTSACVIDCVLFVVDFFFFFFFFLLLLHFLLLSVCAMRSLCFVIVYMI